ncbi:MAG: hypothetical protein J5724_05475 [Ruminococcus sp.]|uniref:hypothetical protein n=1 Tax=Ruminococcus sp. TaxID=41978 RepID=UPI001B4D8CB7|nr:hypothetical protein [Ruminococcus sp.]MBO4493821.1 hypothetical protein [Ruminococcus sp.]MBP5433923.1 hypothetical protein [Ruminococcus sp.]
MDNINIEQIMADIKRDIKEKGLTPDMLSFEDIPYKKTAQGGSPAEAVDYVTSHYYVQPYQEFTGNPVKVFFKKALRKVMRFYVDPIVMEQNDFNANTAIAIKAISEDKSKDMNNRVETLEIVNRELAKRLEKLERENAELRSIITKEQA